MIRRRLTALAAPLTLAAALAAPAAAQDFDFDSMSEAQREAFGNQVRNYLLENPEVLMEAIDVLDQRQSEAQAANDEELVQSNAAAIRDDGYSWVGGNPDGDVTLVEFMDYRCGYCRRANPEVEELVESDGDIRYVVKEFPILGPGSVLSSQFAIAVKQLHGDEAYKQVHDALISLRSDATEESLRKLAGAMDFEADPIFEKMESDEVAEVISKNHALAQELQITGTPTFVLGDNMMRGYVPLQQMRQAVEQVRDSS